ncbi:Hpt domain-containing protein [Rhodovulum sulfidophilum]|uniref:Hpt domain-containing protein n=1 Tax=Rhodovulum sulfidophilum TaxID=35806 RepID=UPI0009514017|nr:Hpt domain-containing protein [Rhodovulum sulfidophilum]MBL3564593.1 Hpt domain-containing protein [Rhodovulum sulfidophilum]MBL3573951.1 Hpt domain-containing protein [Rhodovulum sulfidophilum]MBL3594575.1 Hpt domain-containing protein [Rhodovulum sulfidophilum]MCE8430522.1 Hpt domain-containing protein [Rhodovulum sulfidophilum]MCF4118372.1 Hpt domain-containing protein [Rhodovulum sulfidophilum]
MIDWTRVDELRCEVGEDAFDEVLELFLEEVDEVIGRLDPERDPADLAADLHFVRGSALNLGFRDFCMRCQGIEHQLAQRESIDLAPLLAAYAGSKAELLTRARTRRDVA